jgi:anti-sigma-K factor RskA
MNTMNDTAERHEIEDLLPWHATGTLNLRDAERVEKAMSADRELARRFDIVREELAETIHLNESLGAPSARCADRLFAAIAAEPPRKPARSLDLATRFADFVAGFSPRTLAWSASAAALAIVLQAGVLTGLLIKEQGGEAGYETASYEAGQTAKDDQALLIRFNPATSADEIAKFVETYKVVLMEPKPGGLFRVRVAMTGIPKEEIARIVKQMQESKAVGFAAPTQ